MRLVFIHGWGFDPHFWDVLAAALARFPQTRVDLGFFGGAVDRVRDDEPAILIGHSLGFLHGMRARKNWAGWVAINSFPRFVATPTEAGCVSAASLRAMRGGLLKDAPKTLADFYRLIGAAAPAAAVTPHVESLRDGLDVLRDASFDPAVVAGTGLVLAAKNDPLVPIATSAALAASADRIAWHAGGGHLLPQNATAWCAEQIVGFVDDAQGRAP